MRQPRSQNHIASLAALLLLAVFAVPLLLTLLEGASVYRRLTDRDRESWEGRTAFQYIATRLRQEARLDALVVEDFEGVPALTLGGDGEYLTRLYCYDGSLRELYSSTEVTLSPADGESLLELAGMDLALSDGLLWVELTTPGGSARQLVMDLSRAGGVAP